MAGPDAVRFQSPVELDNRDLRSTACFKVQEGQTTFRFAWLPSHLDGPVVGDIEQDLETTEAWWHDWAARCT